MKKAILFVGALFFVLMTMPSYAQKTSKRQKENNTKTEKLQKNPASKVEEKGVSTPDHNHAKAEERGIGVPDYWHNPSSKTRIARISQKLTFQNMAFQIKSSTNGFDLYKDGSSSVYAKLVPTQKEGLYRYTSSSKNGAAHFDTKGNLIMKYLDNDTGKIKEMQFQSN